MNITINQTAIIIPFEDAIALYQTGYFDPALLANYLPVEIAKKECPEILRDGYEISQLAEILRKDKS